MPFGKWKNWEDCIADIRKKNPDYSEETVRKVCGKLQAKLEKCTNPEKAYAAIKSHLEKADADSVVPMTAGVDPETGQMQIKKSWSHALPDILKSPRRAEMTFHIPKVDKDVEFITADAMAMAMRDYSKFPIISEFHKERPIGIAERIWQTGEDEFKALVRIRNDEATDDVWNKINLPKGTPGRYDQVSIAGKRIVYSPECDIPVAMRKSSQPCRTEAIRLDSISVCDDRARNDGTELAVVKAQSDDLETFIYTTALEITQVEDKLIKAETTDSELIHPVTDGASQPDETFVEDNIVCPLIHPGTDKIHPKGGKMEKCTGKPVKKTSDEDAQASAEETEARKSGKKTGEPELDGMKKGEEGAEEHTEAKDTGEILREMHKMMSEIHELIMSDKEVHAKIERKGEPPDEDWKDKEEEGEVKQMEHEEEGRARREERKDDASTPRKEVKKAAMEQDFQKALAAAVAPLQAQITILAQEVQKIGDQPLYKSGVLFETLQTDKDGKPEMGNAGAQAAMRKKSQGGR